MVGGGALPPVKPRRKKNRSIDDDVELRHRSRSRGSRKSSRESRSHESRKGYDDSGSDGEILQETKSTSLRIQDLRLLPLENEVFDSSSSVEEGRKRSSRSKVRRHKSKKKKHRLKVHSDSNSETAVDIVLEDRPDYVLIYSPDSDEELEEAHNVLRLCYEAKLRASGIRLQRAVNEESETRTVIVYVYASFERLCEEAERMAIHMDLAGTERPPETPAGCDSCLEQVDDPDFSAAPFRQHQLKSFEGSDNHDTFFRPALRGLMTNSILSNTDLRPHYNGVHSTTLGIGWLLMTGVYDSTFPVHWAPNYFRQNDDRDDLDFLRSTWLRSFKYQPLFRVRNYFGERIALLFAWTGFFASYLWVPTFLGIGVFSFGIIKLIINGDDQSFIWRLSESFDNDLTPYFALFMCIWGTVFLEYWKRREATLAYEWDMVHFEDQEPDLPEYYGTMVVKNSITGEMEIVYPEPLRLAKVMASLATLFTMVLVVIASVTGIIVFRVAANNIYFNSEGNEGMLAAFIVAALNACSIQLLNFIYNWIARYLNKWENHRTRTQAEDALIWKTFAFHFVNSYAALYYIAFFRGRYSIIIHNEELSDACIAINTNTGETTEACFGFLSINILVILISKCLGKLFIQEFLPFVKYQFKKRRRFSNVIDIEKPNTPVAEIERQSILPLDHNVLKEYNDKVIFYGYITIFAASMPLAPLVILLFTLVDMRLDAKRFCNKLQRPPSFRAQDIGMWSSILLFVNAAAVITNAFMIALSSRFGEEVAEKHGLLANLWIIIIFEHAVFAVKFGIAYLIPDVPHNISEALRLEKLQSTKLLNEKEIKMKRREIAEEYSSKEIRRAMNAIPKASRTVEKLKAELQVKKELQQQRHDENDVSPTKARRRKKKHHHSEDEEHDHIKSPRKHTHKRRRSLDERNH